MTIDLSSLELRRFDPDGPAAIDPRALAKRWAARTPVTRGADGYALPYSLVGDVAVVSVDGPLMQRGGGYYFDGYDAVTSRVQAALAEPQARAVVLKLNSPGGMAAGCFEASRAIRASAQAAGKPLVAYADEQACSAAYALACAASQIYLPPSGEVGSIGVLSAVVSMKRGLEADGIDAKVIRSGAMKASGHPFDALTDEAVAREQSDVDALAAQFFALVSSSRGMTPDAAAALEGDTRLGAQAVAAGLADAVCAWGECLSRAGAMSPNNGSAMRATNRGKAMDENERKLLGSVLALTGETDPEKATGKIAAWKSGNERLEALQTENARLKADGMARSRAAIIAEGVRTMKLTPAQVTQIEAGQGWLASLSNEGLQGYVTEAIAQGPGPVRQPEPPKLNGAPVDIDAMVLTAAELASCKTFGTDPADLLATKKRNARIARGEVV